MPRSKTKLRLTDEEKKEWRREKKKNVMRQKRATLDAAAIEERRKKDRERYQRKKENGLITTIKDLTSGEQRKIRKVWREKTKIRREKEKIKKWAEVILQDTPSSSTSASYSRVAAHTKLVIDALKAQCTLVTLVKRELPVNTSTASPTPSSPASPAPTSLALSIHASVSQASLPKDPTKLNEAANSNEDTEL